MQLKLPFCLIQGKKNSQQGSGLLGNSCKYHSQKRVGVGVKSYTIGETIVRVTVPRHGLIEMLRFN